MFTVEFRELFTSFRHADPLMKTIVSAILALLSITVGCMALAIEAPKVHPQLITYNGTARMVLADPIEKLMPGDEVLVRKDGTNAVAIIGSRRGPGVYRLRNLEFNLLTAANYAGRLFEPDKAWMAAQGRTAIGPRFRRRHCGYQLPENDWPN